MMTLVPANAQSITISGNLVSPPLRNPVTLDGVMSSASEWADAIPVNVSLGLGVPPKAPYVSAEIWSKYDSAWIYFLFKINWPSSSVDKSDAAYVEYFWGRSGAGLTTQYSDYGQVSYANQTWDGYGFDGKMFHSDTDAGGKNNVQGAATYDGAHYWFEFRKALNSNDGFDWTLTAGHTYGWQNDTSTYGGYLSLGLWDGSKREIYIVYLTLDLSNTQVPMAFFGLTISVYVLRCTSRVLSRRTSLRQSASNGFESLEVLF